MLNIFCMLRKQPMMCVVKCTFRKSVAFLNKIPLDFKLLTLLVAQDPSVTWSVQFLADEIGDKTHQRISGDMDWTRRRESVDAFVQSGI